MKQYEAVLNNMQQYRYLRYGSNTTNIATDKRQSPDTPLSSEARRRILNIHIIYVSSLSVAIMAQLFSFIIIIILTRHHIIVFSPLGHFTGGYYKSIKRLPPLHPHSLTPFFESLIGRSPLRGAPRRG